MPDQAPRAIAPCKKSGHTDRYPSGACRPCRIAEGRRRTRATNTKPCEICGRTDRYPSGNCKVCSKKGVVACAHGVYVSDLQEMYRSQKGLCALTGRPLDGVYEVDRIIPKSRGGANGLDNLRLVCREANRAKHSLTDEELLQLCKDILTLKEGSYLSSKWLNPSGSTSQGEPL